MCWEHEMPMYYADSLNTSIEVLLILCPLEIFIIYTQHNAVFLDF